MKKILLLTLLLASLSFAQEFVIKFATLAPEGSTWINIMREYDAAVKKESNRQTRIPDLRRRRCRG